MFGCAAGERGWALGLDLCSDRVLTAWEGPCFGEYVAVGLNREVL